MQLAVEEPPDAVFKARHLVGPLGAQRSALQGDESAGGNTGAAPAAALTAALPASTGISAATGSPGCLLVGRWEKIDGCAAAASVRVSLHAPETPISISSRHTSGSLCCTATKQGVNVSVEGESDSLVVGGLLQLLARSLSGGPSCGVWALRAFGAPELLRRSGLLHLLPESRPRGLQGALEVLVASTRDLLEQYFAGGKFPSGLTQETDAAEGPKELPEAATTRRTAATTVFSAAALEVGGEEASRKPNARNDSLLATSLDLRSETPEARILPPVGPPGSRVLREGEAAEWSEIGRASLPAVGGAGAEVHVLVSGGVDSSVSLLLMREWGFRPKPVFLKVWAPEATHFKQQLHHQQGKVAVAAAAAAAAAACPWEKDVEAAAAAAAAAGLTLEVVPMQQQYWDRVIAAFLEGARSVPKSYVHPKRSRSRALTPKYLPTQTLKLYTQILSAFF